MKTYNEVAKRAADYYPALSTESTVELLDYSENATYLVRNQNTGEKHILRVCRPGYHTKSTIQGEIYWLNSVYKNTEVDVSLPLKNNDDEYVQTILLEGDPNEYHCVLFTFLEGKEPDVDNEEKLIAIFEQTGEITAHFHNHVVDNWEEFNAVERPVWDCETILGENPKWGKWEDGLGMTPAREELFQSVSDVIQYRLAKYGKDSDRFGLIHADLRHANLLIDEGQVRVIDFDDSGFGWYMFDLASSLSFIEHRPYVPLLIESWLKGYRKVRFISEKEEAEIPTFILLRRLQLVSWVGSRENETTEELGSEYTIQTDQMAYAYLEKFSKELEI